MNSQLLLLLAVLMPGAVIENPPDRTPPQAAPVSNTDATTPTGQGANPHSEGSARLEGRRLFVRYGCANCHGWHGRGGSGPSLRDATTVYGDDPGELFVSIASGRVDGMPAWGTILPSEEIWKLVAYVGSMRGARQAVRRSAPDLPSAPALQRATGANAS